jgi:hypothetical protein
MQNKANLPDAQMNVNSLITKDYRKNDAFAGQKNKPNSKPIKANWPDAQMSVNSIFTKDYERNDIFAVPENKANLKNRSQKTEGRVRALWAWFRRQASCGEPFP